VVSGALLPAEGEKTAQVRAMFDAIAPRYDLVNRLITFGLDQSWRRRTLRSLGLPAGSVLLDLACGTGALGELARRAGYRVVGVDMSAGMLATRTGGGPALRCDASSLGLATGSFDGVVCGYALRNFTDLGTSLAEAARVLRPGGRIAVLEVATPPNPLLRAGHAIWFRHVVPLIGAILSDPAAYRYLPASVAYLPDDHGLRQLFRDAGFATVGRQLLLGGLSQVLTATRTGLLEPSPAAARAR
jgi:demethylmenaquinone methyltransferase / 2-methoxy-6-polyprenyl-1,4-benzoquinol methylase